MKNISILGSTGSVGTQTLDVIREHKDHFRIFGLSTNKNIDLLEAQINEFKPKAVCVMDMKKANILRDRIKGNNTKVYTGIEGLIEIASLEKVNLMVNSL